MSQTTIKKRLKMLGEDLQRRFPGMTLEITTQYAPKQDILVLEVSQKESPSFIIGPTGTFQMIIDPVTRGQMSTHDAITMGKVAEIVQLHNAGKA
jgi:hypothetical protein